MKKWLCLLTALVLFAVAAGTVAAEEGSAVSTDQVFRYELSEDGTVEITGYDGADANIVIPAEIDGKKVTSIGENAFFNHIDLVSVTIPDGVEQIGASAFRWCDRLAEITIPESVRSIGESAFSGCKQLTSVALPAAMTEIENRVFYGCSRLADVSLPDTVTVIGEAAFFGCSSLAVAPITESIEYIDDSAFAYCTALTGVSIPEGVEYVGSLAFSHCAELTEASLPLSVTSIGVNPFYVCKKLETIEVPEGGSYLSSVKGVLYCQPEKKLVAYPAGSWDDTCTIPDGTEIIGKYAFADCENLWIVSIPNSIRVLEDRAFCRCKALTTLILGSGIESVNAGAFHQCPYLAEITVGTVTAELQTPGDLTGIDIPAIINSASTVEEAALGDEKAYQLSREGIPFRVAEAPYCNIIYLFDEAKENVTGLQAVSGDLLQRSIVIPEGVTEIAPEAFKGYPNLKKVVVPDTVTLIGPDAFAGNDSILRIMIHDNPYVEQYCLENELKCSHTGSGPADNGTEE